MKKTKEKLPSDIRLELIRAINSARLQGVTFTGEGGGDKIVYNRKEWRITDFITERVRLHHDKNIVGPLMRILAWSEGVKVEDFREPQGVERYNNKPLGPLSDIMPGHHPLYRSVMLDVAHDTETQIMIGVQTLLSDLDTPEEKMRVLEYLLAKEKAGGK